MTKTIYLLIFTLFALTSCRLAERDYIGTYSLDRFPKTRIKINQDKTFEFVKINRNPYLHPSAHPDEYFYITRGSWVKTGKRVLTLTSQQDTLVYPLVTVKSSPPRDKDWSYFSFFDTDGDTVRIVYVQHTDKSISFSLHNTMRYFMEDLTKKDTFEFIFYGYRPYIFISGQKVNQDFQITMRPEFQPKYFKEAEFRIKRRQLIDIKRNGKFRKLK